MKHGRVQNLKTLFVPGALITSCALVFSLTAASVSAEVYKWTDENGVTHYSQTPPPTGQEAEVEDLPEFQDAPVEPGSTQDSGSDTQELSAADLRRQELAASRRERAEEQAATEALCLDTQQRLDQLEPSRRVFYTDENGETARMDDEQRAEEIQRLRDILRERCQ